MAEGVNERRFTITASQSIQLGDFFARQVLVQNLLPSWVYLRVGGTDIPSARTADIPIAPMSTQIIPITTANLFGVFVGPALVTLGQQVATGQAAIITFYSESKPVAIGSIDLNPSRLGQMTQQKFVAANSYTIAFPVTTVHVANYSPAWVYVRFNSLVIPTAATADVSIPPMSEKSLTCLPATNFAFGLSANLVTTGQQIPAGVQIIATFYEYPTAPSIGTADLNPSKMGQMVQQKFTAAASYTIGFPATTVHVANYSLAWLYVKFASLVIPTVTTADVAVPPMSEKSLTCLPATQFAFGFSANLVTQGQQMPTGTQVIATFFEYPTPVSVGTADLNPTRLGQSATEIVAANRPVDPLFPVSQINVANYLQRWLYATYSQTNRLTNPDVETWAAGVPVGWQHQGPSGGTLTQSASYRGLYGARITRAGGAGADTMRQLSVAVTPGEALAFSFWYMTNGAIQGSYAVYDASNLAWIIAPAATGAAPTAYTWFYAAFVVPAGCNLIDVYVLNPNGNPAGSWSQYDTLCIQPQTTAANAQIAVPPLSEKSVTVPPTQHIDWVMGAQTVMIATGLPVTQAIVTVYEYPVPQNLGIAPLSPGGFRYTESIIAAGAHGTADMNAVYRDLSNFSRARLTLSWQTFPGFNDLNIKIEMWRCNAALALTSPIACTAFAQTRYIELEFAGGCIVHMLCDAMDSNGNAVGGWTLVVTGCFLEAW